MRRKKRNRLTPFLTIVLAIITFMVITGAVGVYIIINKYGRDLPNVLSLKSYSPSLITKIYSDDHELLNEFYVERRILVPLSRIPKLLREATIAVEDAKFYRHHGVDIMAIIRALWVNIRAGKVVEGGSTITQQLAKAMFLTPDKTIVRKIKEAMLAIKIERNFTKDEILELYLNQIYYGHGAYGVEAASRTYFGRDVDELDLSEIALLAGLPRAPNIYSPYFFKENAFKRRRHVLYRMVETNIITKEDALNASKAEFNLIEREKGKGKAPYFVEYVRMYLEEKYGSEILYHGGMTVNTTINLNAQRLAEQALIEGINVSDKRLGYRGPLLHIASKGLQQASTLPFGGNRIDNIDWEDIYKRSDPLLPYDKLASSYYNEQVVLGIVKAVEPNKAFVVLPKGNGILMISNMSWAKPLNPSADATYGSLSNITHVLSAGDVIKCKIASYDKNSGLYYLLLEQDPLLQGAIISINPKTGYIIAMAGGYDFSKSQFNRAVQATRQPGSAFKPITYGAAINSGFTPASIILDSPIVFTEYEKDTLKWKPVNFEEKFYGPTTLRTAITYSRNIVTIKLMQQIGVKEVINYAKRLGITSPLEADLSLALGSSGVTLKELTYAYGVFANQGIKAEPMFIKNIKDRHGNILEENMPKSEMVVPEDIAFIMTNLLINVIQHGTGKNIKELGRPAAGKTGTTNNFVDAWFIGYTPNMVSGVWVGYDKEVPIGRNETGARVAGPIWLNFMKNVLKGKPIEDFHIPLNVEFVKIDPKTGLLADYNTKGAYFEVFREGTAPTEYTSASKRSNFFEIDMEQ